LPKKGDNRFIATTMAEATSPTTVVVEVGNSRP
jgi:hypothetical protein